MLQSAIGSYIIQAIDVEVNSKKDYFSYEFFVSYFSHPWQGCEKQLSLYCYIYLFCTYFALWIIIITRCISYYTSKAGTIMSGAKLKAEARSLIGINAPRLIFISIVFIIVTAIIAELQFRLPVPSNAYDELLARLSAGAVPSFELFFGLLRPYGLALAVLLWIMTPVISVGYTAYCMKITRKEKGDFKDLLSGFSIMIKVILIALATTAIVMLWSLLLFFPGLAAHYRYRQVYYILLDDPDKGVFQCISESQRLMRGRKLDLFLIDLSFLGWIAASLIVSAFIIPFLPVVSVWLTPYYCLTQAAYYNQMIKEVAV